MDFGRWNLGSVFTEIAREHYKFLIDDKPKLDAYNKRVASSDEESGWFAHEKSVFKNEMNKNALITIVFSAMALESYIYDFAARHTSDTFVQKYLDKLDTVSKWVIIPQMVSGKEFPREGQAFQLLSKLVRERNFLVHYKSSDVDYEKLDDYLNKNENRLINSAKDAIDAVDAIIKEMNKLDPTEPVRLSLGHVQ